jgi:glycosyltransferase involved in cell wall biosynthesis
MARAGHVRFFGARSDVADLLPETDLVLLASHEESFGLSALEGMACGVPVVAPRLGGLPEVVTDGRAGLLFHAGDEEHAAACALSLLTDPPRHWELRQGASSRAREFAERLVLPRYEALYRTLLPETAVFARAAGAA